MRSATERGTWIGFLAIRRVAMDALLLLVMGLQADTFRSRHFPTLQAHAGDRTILSPRTSMNFHSKLEHDRKRSPLFIFRASSKRNTFPPAEYCNQTHFSSAEIRAACPSSSRREAIACTTPAASTLLPE